MTYDVEHHFICLFAISMSSLVKCLYRSFAPFKIRLFMFFFLIFKKNLTFIYYWETERHRVWAGEGTERGGDTESEAGSRLWAVSTEPDVGLKLTNYEIMTWAEVRHLTHWATQVPQKFSYVITTPLFHWTNIRWSQEFFNRFLKFRGTWVATPNLKCIILYYIILCYTVLKTKRYYIQMRQNTKSV